MSNIEMRTQLDSILEQQKLELLEIKTQLKQAYRSGELDFLFKKDFKKSLQRRIKELEVNTINQLQHGRL